MLGYNSFGIFWLHASGKRGRLNDGDAAVCVAVKIENANVLQNEQNVVGIVKMDMLQAMQDSGIKHVKFRDERRLFFSRAHGYSGQFLGASDVRGGFVPADNFWAGWGRS